MLAGERHPAGPGAGNSMLVQKREKRYGMLAVERDARGIGPAPGVDLAITAKNDLTAGGLASIEMACDALGATMGEFARRVDVAVWIVMPGQFRFDRADAVKDSGRQRFGGPHLA